MSLSHGHNTNGQRWTKPVLIFFIPRQYSTVPNLAPNASWVESVVHFSKLISHFIINGFYLLFKKNISMLCSNGNLGVSGHIKKVSDPGEDKTGGPGTKTPSPEF